MIYFIGLWIVLAIGLLAYGIIAGHPLIYIFVTMAGGFAFGLILCVTWIAFIVWYQARAKERRIERAVEECDQ